MARQRGNKFQADVMVDGKRKRPSFGTLAAAQAFEDECRLGITPAIRARVRRERDAPGFKRFHQENFEIIWGDNKSPQATRFNLVSLDKYIPADMPLRDISTAVIVRMTGRMKKDGASNGTINRRLSALSRLLKYAERLELIHKPPIDFLKEPQGRERILSPDEEARVSKFFRHTGLDRSWAVTFFLLYTGCRLGEVYSLRRDRVSNGRVTFHYSVTKTSKTRLVPLIGPAKDAWDLICAESDEDLPFSVIPKETFRNHWLRLRDHLRLTNDAGFVPHMLRHTCASRLVSKGVPLAKVMLWMGHTSIQTTMRYSHLMPQDLDGIGDALWPPN